MKKNKEAKKYLAAIRRFLSAAGIYDRRFYRGLKGRVEDYCLENTGAGLTEIREEFGDEREIFQDYLESMEMDVLAKRIRWTYWAKVMCAALICLCAAGTIAYGRRMYAVEKEFEANMMSYYETEIEYYYKEWEE